MRAYTTTFTPTRVQVTNGRSLLMDKATIENVGRRLARMRAPAAPPRLG